MKSVKTPNLTLTEEDKKYIEVLLRLEGITVPITFDTCNEIKWFFLPNADCEGEFIAVGVSRKGFARNVRVRLLCKKHYALHFNGSSYWEEFIPERSSNE